MRKVNCKARLHDWDKEPPGPGSTCKQCGKKFGENPPGWKPWSKARPKVPQKEQGGAAVAAASQIAGQSEPARVEKPLPAQGGLDLSRLQARWAPAAAAPAATTTAPAAAQPADKTADPKKKLFSEKAAKPIADFTIWGSAKMTQLFGREPGKPDPEWMTEYRDSWKAVLQEYLPDVEMGPLGNMLFAFGVVTSGMVITSKKIEKSPPQLKLVPAPSEPAKQEATPPAPPAPVEKPKLSIVKSSEKESPEWSAKNAQPKQSPAPAPDGAQFSGASDLSSLTFDFSQTFTPFAAAGSGSAPGAVPNA